MTEEAFITALTRLAEVYREDQSPKEWAAKQYLGAYYSHFLGSRNSLTQPLHEIDWMVHSDALRRAVEGGANLILVGEDMGIEPASGLTFSHHGYGRQLEVVADAFAGAAWGLSSTGNVLRIRLGRGSLTLSRTTPDMGEWGHTNPAQLRWQREFLAAMDGPGKALPGPLSAAELRGWLTGRVRLLPGDPVVSTLSGPEGVRSGRDWSLRVPPFGNVVEAKLTVADGNSLRIDVGALGLNVINGAASEVDVTAAVREYLSWREREMGGVERDDDGWRLVPVRFRTRAGGAVDVTVNQARIVAE